MINGMYLSTMGAMVQSTRHATIANNLANANTAGFKPDWTIFRAIPSESEWQGFHRSEVDAILEKTGGGVWLERTVSDFRPGPTRPTGNPLDLALVDSTSGYTSFFMVRPIGESEDVVRYTRDGHFTLDQQGRLVTTEGALVLDPGGGPIELEEEGLVYVGEDGTVRRAEDNAAIAQIGVVRTSDPNKMEKLGDNLLDRGEAELVNQQAGVKTEMLEDSATNAISEMASMIEAHRTYEANMTFLRIQDESLGDTVRRVAAIA